MSDPSQMQPFQGSDQRNNQKYWAGGLFYINPNDKRLWVEKRFGYGWTLNFARPIAWWLSGGFFALLAIMQLVFFIAFQNAINLVIFLLFFGLLLVILIGFFSTRSFKPGQ